MEKLEYLVFSGFMVGLSVSGMYLGAEMMETIFVGDVPGFIVGAAIFGGSFMGFLTASDAFRSAWTLPWFNE